MPGALHPVRDFIHPFVVFLLGFAEGLFLSRKSGEVKSVRFDLRPIEHHRRALLDEHFVNGPTGEVNGRGLSANHAACAVRVKAAAAGNGKNFGDTRGAGDRDVLARGRHGRGCDNVRVVISRLCRIHGGADCPDLPQSHLGDRVEDSRVDLQSFCIDHLGLSRDINAHANGRDFSIANDQRAIFDGAPSERKDFRMSQSVSSGRLRLRACQTRQGADRGERQSNTPNDG